MTVGGMAGAKPPPYEQLENGTLDNGAVEETAKEATPQPILISQPDPTTLFAQNKQVFRRQRHFKILVGVELGLALLFVALGAAIVGTSGSYYFYHNFSFRRYSNAIGSGIWAGLFACVAASFGVAAAYRPRNRCLMMTYFILAIITLALFIPLILIFASFGVENESTNMYRAGDSYRNWQRWVKEQGGGSTPNYDRYDSLDEETYANVVDNIRSAMAMQALLIAGALVHAVVTAASLGLVCYNWGKGLGACCGCCGGEEIGPIVVYVAPGTHPDQIQNAINAIRPNI